MKIAVIDIGTNSIHMVIALVKPNGSFEIVGREKDMTRIGDGTLKRGKFSQETIEKALDVVSRFHKLAQNKNLNKIVAVATSAVREATNGGLLVERIQKATGIKTKVVSGEEEARLIYLAVKHSIDFRNERAAIVDIGGGSAEIMVGDAEKLHYGASLKLGGARLKDLFFEKETPSKDELKKLSQHVEKGIEGAVEKVKSLKPAFLVGTSGTIVNLAYLANSLNGERLLDSAHHYTLTLEQIKSLHKKLAEMSLEERLKLKELDPQRADLVVPATAVLIALMRELGFKELTVCTKAIREGIVYDFIEKNRAKLKDEETEPNLRRRHVLQLAARCEYEAAHAHQVARLALSLFDQSLSLHRMGEKERELLEYAALLHDIGYHISYQKHHKHSFYLIQNADLAGFTPEEIDIIANIARYHRKSPPKETHEGFMALSSAAKQVVLTMSALLRIADGLDRSHFRVVEGIQCHGNNGTFSITLQAHGDPELEIWGAAKKGNLFEKIFDKELKFAVKKTGGA